MDSKFVDFTPEATMKLVYEAVLCMKERGMTRPEVGIILGSGLGDYAEKLENPIRISYKDIPGFLVSTAPGHKGEMIYGTREGKKVLIMSGRFHYYEGYRMSRIVFPVRVMAAMGVKRLVITNAAGAINTEFKSGSLMLVSDHINMSGNNPLIGPNLSELGVRFPDMTDLYKKDLRKRFMESAAEAGLPIHEGVYAMMSGPSFETPAEIRFLRAIGADAVGMSSVPEAITAGHAGMEVLTISALANAAAGVLDKPLTGEEVIEASKALAVDFAKAVDIAVSL